MMDNIMKTSEPINLKAYEKIKFLKIITFKSYKELDNK